MASALRDFLPRGQTLPQEDWASRHRAMLIIVWGHVLALPVFALLRGFSPEASIGAVVPIAIAGWVASLPDLGRRARSIAVVFALLTSSAVLVHAWNGQIEAHFHFFVMIAVLALYEDWLPFGLAIAYVVIEHGVLGAISPHSVYDHGGNVWAWAGIHGLFVLGLVAACVVTWRLNEEMRARMGEAHDHARANDERFRLAFETGVAGMSLCTPAGEYLSVNRAMCEITGYAEDELIGRDFRSITHPDDVAIGTEQLRAMRERQIDSFESEKRYLHSDGHVVWVQFGVSAVRGQDPAAEYFITQITDITERKRAEDELAHRALHDPLTGLANRALFGDRLAQALVRLRRRDASVAVLFVDLDRFKLVNDGMGHGAGDAVLAEAARRLSEATRAEDTVARLGGDEFTVLCEVVDETSAKRVAGAILVALALPFTYDGREFHLSASVGMRATSDPATSSDELMRDADTALYAAKRNGRGRLEVFDAAAHSDHVDALATDQALRTALARDELRLHYQPEIDLETGAIVAVEALVRWQHPERGLIPPGEFIPVAEETGLIVPMGEWVLQEACRQLTRWRTDGTAGGGLTVAVNVSARQLSDPGLPAAVASALAAADLDAASLCVEITESAIVQDTELALANVHAIKRLGVRVALDDFGVGFSSFSQIRELPPVDVIKIDRSFTAGLNRSRSDAAVVTAVLSLARSLRLSSVAEGVETVEQLQLLRRLGCDVGQGFHFARPLPPDQAAALLATSTVSSRTGALDGASAVA